MNAGLAVSIAVLLTACGSGLPAQTHRTNQVSVELNEFLSREGVRDPETGAILKVRPKVPRFFDNLPLDCSIRKLTPTNQVSRYEIVLTVLQMTGTEVHERIVLDAEPTLLHEVFRQERYRSLAPVREKRLREVRAKKIAEMTNGALSYGMTKAQAVAVKGDDWKPGPQYQKAGCFELRYDDITLLFDTTLVDAYPAGEVVLGNPSPKPVPLYRFEQQDKR